MDPKQRHQNVLSALGNDRDRVNEREANIQHLIPGEAGETLDWE